jgi:predicted enzyme related to lactoylglutathione lyase
MVGSEQPKVMAEFYEKVFGKKADSVEGNWYGWQIGSAFFSVGEHSEVKGPSKDPSRLIFNFESKDVKEEFARIKGLGAIVVKEPYTMEGWENGWIATFADPDGNYFQLMTPWESEKMK